MSSTGTHNSAADNGHPIEIYPAITAKHRIPESRPEWLARQRLVGVLTGLRSARVVLIRAPAGYGKSVLAAQWRSSPAEPRPFAWLSLDEADDDPCSLWSAMATAVGRTELICDGREDLLPRLADTLEPPMVLLLDGFSTVRNGDCLRQVARFIDLLPPDVQLVLLTRGEPVHVKRPQRSGSAGASSRLLG